MHKLTTLGIALSFLLILPLAKADTQAVSLGSYYDFTNGSWTLGFEFSPTANLDVTSLGSFFPVGATDIHGITLWNTAGTVLATTTVTGTGIEGFNFTPIAPLLLTVGTDYIIGANTLSDAYAVIGTSPTYAPEITFLGHTEAYCGGITPCYPGPSFGNSDLDYGANFTYVAGAAAVPEPGSILLLLTGIVGVGVVFRNKPASLI